MHGSLTTVPNGEICYTETMKVVLNSYAKGVYGFALNKQQNLRRGIDDCQQRSLFISYIEKGSPAERSGVLQVGDRILAIDDWCTANGSVDEANKRIRQSSGPLTLTVEFDVIESVIPANGILNVKLAKRGNNLGIIVRCDGEGKKGEPVVISDIRTGSVAHRCGSIQVGDHVLAIDNFPLNCCTVEEAMRLLKRSGEVVKLRIRKTSTTVPDESDSFQKVVYSIELNRKGKPVGITIASSGKIGDPVIISQLAPNGLAERTGAFRVGDQILAINGESIEGKKVSDAIRLLQQNADLVTIKICRALEPATATYTAFYNSTTLCAGNQRFRHSHSTAPSDSFSEVSEKMGTPIQSIDSAVESLEDSPQQNSNNSVVLQQRIASNDQQQIRYRSTADDRTEWRSSNDFTNGPTQSPLSSYGQPLSEITSSHTFHTSNQAPESYGWDSGLSSTTDNNATTDCCLCQKSSTSTDTEDWVKILEALETVGEAEMLQKLEDSIMGGNVPMCKHSHNCSMLSNQPSTSISHSQISGDLQSSAAVASHHQQQWSSLSSSAANTILRQPIISSSCSKILRCQAPNPLTKVHDVLSPDRIDGIIVHSTEPAVSHGISNVPPSMPPPKPPRYEPTESTNILETFKSSNFKSDGGLSYMTSPLQCQSKDADRSIQPMTSLVLHELCPKIQPTSPQQSRVKGTTHRVTLQKDSNTDSFGFSISDGVGDNTGVYINTVMSGGPADKSGNIFPYDRILQVNETSLEYLDCDIAVPLLNVDKIDLVLYREAPTALNTCSNFANNTVSARQLKDSSV
uniref:PDZ domain-containing protein n=1 Tax=Syphacia muris TaxID=451379 RepID=A0A0N5AVQ6_9BILA